MKRDVKPRSRDKNKAKKENVVLAKLKPKELLTVRREIAILEKKKNNERQ